MVKIFLLLVCLNNPLSTLAQSVFTPAVAQVCEELLHNVDLELMLATSRITEVFDEAESLDELQKALVETVKDPMLAIIEMGSSASAFSVFAQRALNAYDRLTYQISEQGRVALLRNARSVQTQKLKARRRALHPLTPYVLFERWQLEPYNQIDLQYVEYAADNRVELGPHDLVILMQIYRLAAMAESTDLQHRVLDELLKLNASGAASLVMSHDVTIDDELKLALASYYLFQSFHEPQPKATEHLNAAISFLSGLQNESIGKEMLRDILELMRQAGAHHLVLRAAYALGISLTESKAIDSAGNAFRVSVVDEPNQRKYIRSVIEPYLQKDSEGKIFAFSKLGSRFPYQLIRLLSAIDAHKELINISQTISSGRIRPANADQLAMAIDMLILAEDYDGAIRLMTMVYDQESSNWSQRQIFHYMTRSYFLFGPQFFDQLTANKKGLSVEIRRQLPFFMTQKNAFPTVLDDVDHQAELLLTSFFAKQDLGYSKAEIMAYVYYNISQVRSSVEINFKGLQLPGAFQSNSPEDRVKLLASQGQATELLRQAYAYKEKTDDPKQWQWLFASISAFRHSRLLNLIYNENSFH